MEGKICYSMTFNDIQTERKKIAKSKIYESICTIYIDIFVDTQIYRHNFIRNKIKKSERRIHFPGAGQKLAIF